MSQNPEEGRLSPEAQAEALRESRKRTVKMRRKYRDMRKEAEAKAKAEQWAANHRKQHQDAYDDLAQAASVGKLNRAQRRHFAKRMNVFKNQGAWKYFMKNYEKTFGQKETKVVRKGKREKRSNIQQALDAAKVTPRKEDN